MLSNFSRTCARVCFRLTDSLRTNSRKIRSPIQRLEYKTHLYILISYNLLPTSTSHAPTLTLRDALRYLSKQSSFLAPCYQSESLLLLARLLLTKQRTCMLPNAHQLHIAAQPYTLKHLTPHRSWINPCKYIACSLIIYY